MNLYPGSKSLIIEVNKESIIKETYGSENLPPAFAPQGGTSRRQVVPLFQRGVIPPFVKGGEEGFSLRCLHYYGLISNLP